MIGAGGLLRSSSGDWIAGFSSCEGVGDIFLAELLAIKQGLPLAWNMNFRKIICESDSLDVINTLLDRSPRVHLQHQWSVSLRHVFRKVNGSAEFLAKLGVRSNSSWKLWNDPPPGLGSLLLKDVLMCMPPS